MFRAALFCALVGLQNNNDPKAKAHYIKYCKILRKVIKEAK